MSEDEAHDAFRMIRWCDTNGDPVCPRCGNLQHSFISTHKLWRYAACKRQLSVTSGTGQFASLNLGEPGQHIFKMLGIDIVGRTEPCEAEHGLGNCILIGRGKPAYGFDRLFEQLRHEVTFGLRVYHGSTHPVPCAM